jgi:hypothetical protein
VRSATARRPRAGRKHQGPAGRRRGRASKSTCRSPPLSSLVGSSRYQKRLASSGSPLSRSSGPAQSGCRHAIAAS